VPITENNYVNFYGVDITEQKNLEEALEKEQQELRLIIDSSPIIVFCKDKEGRFVRVNKAFTESLNIPEEKFLGKTVFDFYSAKIAQSMTNDDHEVFVSGRAKLNIEEQYESTKGLRWVQTDKVPIFDKDSVLVGLVGFAQDITERKRAEDNLRKSEERYRITFENTGTATVLIEEDTTIILANTEFERLSGFSKQEIEGRKKWTEFVAKEDLPWMLEQHHLRRKDKEEAAKQYEFRFVTRNGNIRNIAHLTDVIPGTKRSVASLIDITERKQVEQKILEYQKHLKRLAARLTQTEEQERRRIAGEIHDEISQTLAMVKIKLDTLRNSPPSEVSSAEIEQISSSIEKVIEETRTLTFELSNPILYELGFEAAVAEWLSEQVQEKHGIAIEFQDNGKAKPLDDNVKVVLFRNVRELLTNCIKHASAGRVRVGIRGIDGSIEVVVEDNGVGFDPAQVRTTTGKKVTFGLLSVHESLEDLGGHFEIESKPGAGCKATMVAPMKNTQTNKEM
jgi:PAS domain S-box-containing protein